MRPHPHLRMYFFSCWGQRKCISSDFFSSDQLLSDIRFSAVKLFFFLELWGLVFELKSCLLKRHTHTHMHRAEKCQPCQWGGWRWCLVNSPRLQIWLWVTFLSFWRVLAKHVCWQSVTAPLRLELALCGGFHFSAAAMSDVLSVLVRFKENSARWRWCRVHSL